MTDPARREAPLEERLRARAYGAGFDRAGIARLGAPDTAPAFDDWLERGFAGDMQYLARGAALRHDSRLPEPGMRSALVVALDYGGAEPAGPVARYARGDDYHELMRARLGQIGRWLADESGARFRAYVDTGPVLERDLARRAGLGWFGKNTNLINPRLGSFFFIGALFTDLLLEPDSPFEADRCGTCTRCLDACPTGAFPAPRTLDATRCISYLTIELRGVIQEPLRGATGEHLYGCDICQEVCPWNVKFAREVKEPWFEARTAIAGKDARTLATEILAMSEDEFRTAFKNSPMKRAKLPGLKRNAEAVLENVYPFRKLVAGPSI